MSTTNTSIRTYTWQFVDPLKMDPSTISVADIAHALALTNRWGGHSRVPFSVAAHSLCVEYLTRMELRPGNDFSDRGQNSSACRWALLHDATEAYIGDMPKPIKAGLPDFIRAENNLFDALIGRFHLADECPAIVKQADYQMLLFESKEFWRGSSPRVFGEDAWPVVSDGTRSLIDLSMICDSVGLHDISDWRLAERLFLNRATELLIW